MKIICTKYRNNFFQVAKNRYIAINILVFLSFLICLMIMTKQITLQQISRLILIPFYVDYRNCDRNLFEIKDSDEGAYGMRYKLDRVRTYNIMYCMRNMLRCETYGFTIKIHRSIFESIMEGVFPMNTTELIDVSFEYNTINKNIEIHSRYKNSNVIYWISRAEFENLFGKVCIL